MQFVVKAGNFNGPMRIVTADTGATLLNEVKRVYSLEKVPDTMEIQVWAGYDGTRRLRLDKEPAFETTILTHMAHVRIVSKLREPHQCPVPDEEGQDASQY